MQLTTEQLRALQLATLFAYEAGEIPDDAPEWLHEYTIGDGGLLQLLKQAIEMSATLDRVTTDVYENMRDHLKPYTHPHIYFLALAESLGMPKTLRYEQLYG